MRVAWLSLLFASSALAWPVDFSVSVQLDEPYMHRLSTVDWIAIEDPELADAEILPSGDLLITPKKAGVTHLMLSSNAKFAVWRVYVGGVREQLEPTAEQRAALMKSCPKSRVEDGSFVAVVLDAKCREALLKVLETDAFRPRDLEINYAIPALQAQLAAMSAAVKKELGRELTLEYRGAGLLARGKLTRAEHRKLLWILFRNSAGRIALEDRVEIVEPKPVQDGNDK